MHSIFMSSHVFHHVSVLSSFQENWQDVEVGTLFLIFLRVQLVGIHKEGLAILQVLFYDTLPIRKNVLLSLFHHSIVVFLLLLGKISIRANLIRRRLDSEIIPSNRFTAHESTDMPCVFELLSHLS